MLGFKRSALCALPYAALAAATITSACTTSTSSTIQTGAEVADGQTPVQADDVPAGFSYTLPFAQFDLETVRVLTACPGLSGATEIGFSVTVTATRRFAPGPQVTLSYDALTAPTKTTNFAVTLHENGMLKTINASADDRTGQIIENVVTGIARLQLASLGVAAPAARRAPPCQPAFLADLTALKALDVEIRTQSGVVRTARMRSEDGEARLPLRGQLDSIEADNLIGARRALETENKTLQDLLDSRQRILERLTVRSHYSWPGTPRETEGLLPVSPTERAFLIAVMGEDEYDDMDSLYPLLVSLSLGNGAAAPPPVNLPATAAGALYVTPAQGVFRVCEQNPAVIVITREAAGRVCRTTTGEHLLVQQRTNLPQFARYAQLSLDNGPFENNSLSATFREDGTLAEASFITSRAAAEAASQTFSAAAGTVQSTAAQLATAEAAAEERERTRAEAAAQRELTDIQRRQAVLEAQIAIEQARAGAGSQSALTQLRAEREIAEAELALERANRALSAYRASSAP